MRYQKFPLTVIKRLYTSPFILKIEINDTEELPEGNFPVNLKLINQYQWKYPSLMAKYNMGTYNKGFLCGGSNMDLILIICVSKVVIPVILQIYTLHWYHTYLLYPGMYIM